MTPSRKKATNKLKFKKLIKQAEFIHADLEYHDELAIDAKNLFREEVNQLIQGLSDEEREKLNNLISERERQHQEFLEERLRDQERAAEEQSAQGPGEGSGALEDHPDVELLPEEEFATAAPIEEKTLELKKLFHKIAALTHPDKAAAKGLAKEETRRLEKIFKQATDAYKEGNWYILYCIATDLNIKIDNISLGERRYRKKGESNRHGGHSFFSSGAHLYGARIMFWVSN